MSEAKNFGRAEDEKKVMMRNISNEGLFGEFKDEKEGGFLLDKKGNQAHHLSDEDLFDITQGLGSSSALPDFDQIHENAFLIACENENTDIVNLFISAGKINIMPNFKNYVKKAAESREIINILFNNINIETTTNYSDVLCSAVSVGKYEIVNKLLNMNISTLRLLENFKF